MRKSSYRIILLVFFQGIQLLCMPKAQAQTPPANTPVPAAQERRPLIEVLIELNRVRGAYFLFSQQPLGKVPVNQPVYSPDVPVEKILTQVLKNTGLYFKKVDDRTFVILNRKKPAGPLNFDSAGGREFADQPAMPSGNPDPGIIAGYIMANDGKPLQGVSVTVDKTHKGTMTDLAGAFEIKARREDSLTLSSVGYRTKKIPARLIGTSGIVLDASDQPLTEVMVTAMGIRK